jgi:hypothetical protein
LWHILQFAPCDSPLNWHHAGMMRAPGFAAGILCCKGARQDGDLLLCLLQAVYDRTHRNAALRVAADEATNLTVNTGHISLTDSPQAAPTLPFQKHLHEIQQWLQQPHMPGETNDTAHLRMTWRYRRSLIACAKQAIQSGNLFALGILRRAGWDVAAGQGRFLMDAARYQQADMCTYLLACGANAEAGLPLALPATMYKKSLSTLRVLLAAPSISPPALAAALTTAAEVNDEAIMQELLQHLKTANSAVQGDARLHIRGGVARMLRAALTRAVEGGAEKATTALLNAPVHIGCRKWDQATFKQQTVCAGCAWEARECIPAAVDSGSTATASAVLHACAGWPEEVSAGTLLQALGEDTTRDTPVQAAQRCFHGIVDLFLSHGVAGAFPAAAEAALSAAACAGQFAVMWAMWQRHSINPLKHDPKGIIQAARGSHWQTVVLLLAAGADPSCEAGEALVLAGRYNHLQTARVLLGEPIFHTTAVAQGAIGSTGELLMPHDSVVASLQQEPVATGAAAQAQEGAAAADFAKAKRFVESYQTSCSVSAAVRNSAALREAAASGHLSMVQLLLKHGADASSVQNQALFRAMSGGHIDVVRVLLETGSICVGSDELLMAQRSPQAAAMLLLVQNAKPAAAADAASSD